MENKITILIFIAILLGSVVGYAEGGMITPNIGFVMESDINEVRFDLDFTTNYMSKGDYFYIELPFNVILKETNHFRVENVEGKKWKFTAKDNFKTTYGGIMGSKEFFNDNRLGQSSSVLYSGNDNANCSLSLYNLDYGELLLLDKETMAIFFKRRS